MAYFDQSLLSTDPDFIARISACAAEQETQAGADLGGSAPPVWAAEHQWQIGAAPGFADAYAYALETGVDRPGKDPAVISDADLLAAVQHELAGGTLPDDPGITEHPVGPSPYTFTNTGHTRAVSVTGAGGVAQRINDQPWVGGTNNVSLLLPGQTLTVTWTSGTPTIRSRRLT